MARWILHNETPFTFLITFALGLLFIVAAAFTVSAGLGLLTAGICCVGGGHWVTYLRTAVRR